MFRDPQHGGARPACSREQLVSIALEGGAGALEAALLIPPRARGLALFVHGTTPARCCPRDVAIARELERSGFATLLLDLLTGREADEDVLTGRYALELELFVRRVLTAMRWLASAAATRALPLALLGAGTGAAAVLAAAAELPGRVAAVISCGGRVDLTERATLAHVQAPVLLIEGTAEGAPRACERDARALAMLRAARASLPCARVALVRGATHWLGDPGAYATIAYLAAQWLGRHLGAPAAVHASI